MPRKAAKQKIVYVKAAPKRRAKRVQGGRLYGAGAYGEATTDMVVYEKPQSAPKQSFKQRVQGAMRKAVPDGTFAKIGSNLGSMVPMFGKPASMLGSWLGNKFSKMVGFGKYHVRHNELLPVNMGARVPEFSSFDERGTIVVHREYIGDIVEPANNNGVFTLRNYNLNAALQTTFPWLSQSAVNYDQYKILGAIFEFVSTSSEINNTAGGGIGLGTVVMATDYDSIDNNYINKLQMENAQYCVSGKPSECIVHPIECAPNQTSVNLQYTRSGPVPDGKDGRLYDLGNFQIATQGIPNNAAAQTLGELWISYKVLLAKPQLLSGVIGETIASSHWILPFPTITSVGGAYFGSLNLSIVNAVPGSTLAATVSGDGKILFPIGTIGSYLITYNVVGTAAVLTNNLNASAVAPMAFLNILKNSTGAMIQVQAGVTSTTQIINCYIKFNAPSTASSVFQITAGTLPTAITSADLIITQINTNIQN